MFVLSMGSELTALRMGLTKMQMGMYPILKHGTLFMYRFRSKYIYCSWCALDWNSFIYKSEKRLRKERENPKEEEMTWTE